MLGTPSRDGITQSRWWVMPACVDLPRASRRRCCAMRSSVDCGGIFAARSAQPSLTRGMRPERIPPSVALCGPRPTRVSSDGAPLRDRRYAQPEALSTLWGLTLDMSAHRLLEIRFRARPVYRASRAGRGAYHAGGESSTKRIEQIGL